MLNGVSLRVRGGSREGLDAIDAREPASLHAITTVHIPAILADPYTAEEKKKGDLAHVYGYDLTVKGVAYRLLYQIVEDEIVAFIAVGSHDKAYASARRR